jgi:hypothetical protein
MSEGPLRGARTSGFVLLLLAGIARGDVVIHEIHYNPPAGGHLEFIELRNTSAAPVSIAGWSFTEGIAYLFPEGASIPGNGYAVVCQNRAALGGAFSIPVESLHGDFEGSLDNGGEAVRLTDARGATVDELRYDDVPPWSAAADGSGASLERICDTYDPSHPANWSAERAALPTPLGPGSVEACPPPAIPPPTIAINEIHYHPLDAEDALEEFVELRNNTQATINLRGYSFSTGLTFRFEDDLLLEPGALAVVCRNAEHMRTVRGVLAAVGDFTGQLSNDGERITLVDAAGAYVDSVRYADSGDWPVAGDGLGYSLEKIQPAALSDDPASWKEAEVGDFSEWKHVEVSGPATSSRLLVYLDGAGEILIDNVIIEDPAMPGTNFLPNGTFDTGLEPWILTGNHADTTWDATGGREGGGAMKLVANGRGTGPTNGLYVNTIPELVRLGGPNYKLSFDFRLVTGASGLTFRVSGASASRGMYWLLGAGPKWSPGTPNSAARERLPPFVSRVTRFPQEPGAADPVTITARVRGEGPMQGVTLFYRANDAKDLTAALMTDDGLSGDGNAGDGTFGVRIPEHPHNTILTFKIEAADSYSGITQSPPLTDPTGYHGYYVNDLRPERPLPNYTLLLNHTAAGLPRTVFQGLDCATYRTGSFAYRGDLYYGVGIRQRGQSVCRSNKPYLKVRFQRGREFEGARKINLQSYWTDKSLIREVMAWETFNDVGMPYCQDRFIRLHANGKYFGLYGRLEHPDQRFLDRNRLYADGNLYKATASREEVNGTYEKKTNENGDMSDLRSFLTQLHSTPAAQLKDFFQQRVDEDRVIDYQLGQTLTNNSDYPHKNHYLYHDTERGKWMPLTWDMDLTFGKIWDGTYGGVLHDKMHNPGNTPWYTTSVDGAGGGNHLLDRFFSTAGTWYRRAYLVRLWDTLHEKYREDVFEEKIVAYHDLLLEEQAEDLTAWGRSAATADDPSAPRDFEPNLNRVRDHIRLRRTFLLNYLTTRSRFTGHDRLKITELLYNPVGSEEDLEFIELWNTTGTGIDISGWSIEGIGFTFPSGSTVRKGEIFVVAKNPDVFASRFGSAFPIYGPYTGNLDNDGEILRVKDAGPGYPATVDFLRYGNADGWPREADGLGYSLELTGVHPDRDNDPAANWRASLGEGGTPGAVEGIAPPVAGYTRGDTDANRVLNLTDALVILRYLYLGSGEPPCLAAADVDADEAVKAEDAIFLLNYLFITGEPPIPAPGTRDCAPLPAVSCAFPNCDI